MTGDAAADLSRVRKEIDVLLKQRRPDRYIMSERTSEAGELPNLDTLMDPDAEDNSSAWLDQVAADIDHLIPDAQARRLLARRLVGRQEGNQVQRSHRLLRKIKETGQLVMGWWGSEDEPVAVVTRTLRRGKPDLVRTEHVALRAMTSRDFRAFALEERRAAGRAFTARNATCEGAEWIADSMDRAGATSFHIWAVEELPPPLNAD